jgi:hypothetical protein
LSLSVLLNNDTRSDKFANCVDRARLAEKIFLNFEFQACLVRAWTVARTHQTDTRIGMETKGAMDMRDDVLCPRKFARANQ